VFFKIKKVLLLVSELYICQNARCNDKKIMNGLFVYAIFFSISFK